MVGAADLVLKDCSSLGSAYFVNLRTPAALLAAGALKDAFVLNDAGMEKADRNRNAWVALKRTYIFLMVVSFSLELAAVFMATASGMRLLDGGYNPMATNVMEMLTREFEWEHVAVQAQFVTGILAYVFAQALRVYYALHSNLAVARAATCFVLFSAWEMVGFFNSHVYKVRDLDDLLRRYFTLAMGRATRNLMPFISAVFLALSCAFALQALIDIDADGQLSVQDLRGWMQRLGKLFG